jgi:hypothetical protein
MKTSRLYGPIFFSLLLASGCATTRSSQPQSSSPTEAAITDAHETSFDIAYSLGRHGEHRLTGSASATGASGAPHIATYSESEVVDEGPVNAQRYRNFLEKIVHFTQNPARVPAQDRDCRAPYVITLKIDGKTYTSKGCRVDDAGDLAKLIREGEFLLYSKK